MKKRKLVTLIYCIVIGSVLAFSKDNSPFGGKYRSVADYSQRQMNIHSRILRMFPGTYLDSIGLGINLLNDSIRSELLKPLTKDSVLSLKKCLNNALKDSTMLAVLGRLSHGEEQYQPDINGGVLTVHCKDASRSFAVDSVVMDIFSGSRLIASAMSDKLGVIRVRNIPGGNYSIVFSRRGYAPSSLMYMKVTDEYPYIDIPLQKEGGYLSGTLFGNSWVILSAGLIMLLVSIAVLVYCLTKYKVRSHDRTA